MGTNFHTAWADDKTTFSAASMNPALASLDQAISYQKNVMVFCDDGDLSYAAATGVFTWSGDLKIVFVSAAGNAIVNKVTASNITLSENEFIYVTLSETNNATLTMSKATIPTGGSASTVKAYNVLVLGLRNAAASDSNAVFSPCVPMPSIANGGDPLTTAGGTMTGALIADDNTNYTTAQMRNVILSTGDATGGNPGDVWIKYTA